jgi:hypothetical protein
MFANETWHASLSQVIYVLDTALAEATPSVHPFEASPCSHDKNASTGGRFA